ncbi:MAG: recO [Firmicutes bacterium]|nr:recO [Bacillota bacterium]
MALEYPTEAILLAARDWSAADRMVTLFSREYGIITAMAYGVRKPKSKLSGGLQPFTHLNLLMANTRGMDSVKQCEVQTSFRELREDLTKLAYANFIAELTLGLWPERQTEPAAFEMLLVIFSLLVKRNPRIAALAGAWQLMALAGYQPEYEYCAQCGCQLNLPACFKFSEGGATCLRCSPVGTICFDESDKTFLTKLLAMDLQDPEQFTVNARTLAAGEKLLYGFVRHQLERPLKSLEFISKINTL